jgi:hypothetical protein
MPGYLLHQGATTLCLHGGQAQPSSPNPRVKVSGQMVVTLPTLYTVSACSMPPPATGNGPCVTAQFMTSAVRVKVGGMPVLLQDSQAICVPTGTGLNVVATQMRVKGS